MAFRDGYGLNPMDEGQLRFAVVRACKRLDERGLIAGLDGNVSARLSGNRIVVTPAGFPKRDVTEDDLVILAIDGMRIGGRNEASSEVAMHLAAYRARPEVGAVVHAHPPVATGFAVAGEGLPPNVLPELTVLVGEVPLVPYATPGTAGLPAAMAPWLPNHDAFLLANHGVTTLGRTPAEALARMESVEQCANILLTARLLGRVNELGAEDVHLLNVARRRARPDRTTVQDEPVAGSGRGAESRSEA
jgi:L-fuculose-phosphate aldolase